jgi:hypothetical protein
MVSLATITPGFVFCVLDNFVPQTFDTSATYMAWYIVRWYRCIIVKPTKQPRLITHSGVCKYLETSPSPSS